MSKILKAMNYLNLHQYVFTRERLNIVVYQEGMCEVSTWDLDYHTGNIEDFNKERMPVEQLNEFHERAILDQLKPRVENKMKNKELGFDLF